MHLIYCYLLPFCVMQDLLAVPTQHHETEEWMLICQRNADYHSAPHCDDDYNWSASSMAYSNIDEMPTFISRHRQSAQERPFTTTADPNNLQGKQLAAYNIVKHHMESNDCGPLHMIISGTAGTGKSYLIHCLRLLLREKFVLLRQQGLQHIMSMVVLCILFSVYPLKGNSMTCKESFLTSYSNL